jgi:lipid-binding SYLF domain-containing protein
MTDDAVRLFSSDKGKSIQLGADVGVALGPLGRSAEADIGASGSVSRSLDGSYGSGGVALAPIYTYSLSKGLVSLFLFDVGCTTFIASFASSLMLHMYVYMNGIALLI